MHLALVVNNCRYSRVGGQDLKAHLSIKSTNGNNAQFLLVKNDCVENSLLGGQHLVSLHPDVLSFYCLFLALLF